MIGVYVFMFLFSLVLMHPPGSLAWYPAVMARALPAVRRFLRGDVRSERAIGRKHHVNRIGTTDLDIASLDDVPPRRLLKHGSGRA